MSIQPYPFSVMLRYRCGRRVKKKNASSAPANRSDAHLKRAAKIEWVSTKIHQQKTSATLLDAAVSPISVNSSKFIRSLIIASLSVRKSDRGTLWRWNVTRSSPEQVLSMLSDDRLDRARFLPIPPTPNLAKLTELDLIEFPSLPPASSDYLVKWMAFDRSGKSDLLAFIGIETATRILREAAAVKDVDELHTVCRCLQGALIMGALLTTRLDQIGLSMAYSLWTFLQVAHSQTNDVGLDKKLIWSLLNGLSEETHSYPSGLNQLLAFLELTLPWRMKKGDKEALLENLHRIIAARNDKLSIEVDNRVTKEGDATASSEEMEMERMWEGQIMRNTYDVVDRGMQCTYDEMEEEEEREVEDTVAAITSDAVRRERDGEIVDLWSIGTQTHSMNIERERKVAEGISIMDNLTQKQKKLANKKNRLSFNSSIYDVNECLAKDKDMLQRKREVKKAESDGSHVIKTEPRWEFRRRVESVEKIPKGRRGRKREEYKEKEKADELVLLEGDQAYMKEGNRGRNSQMESSRERDSSGSPPPLLFPITPIKRDEGRTQSPEKQWTSEELSLSPTTVDSASLSTDRRGEITNRERQYGRKKEEEKGKWKSNRIIEKEKVNTAHSRTRELANLSANENGKTSTSRKRKIPEGCEEEANVEKDDSMPIRKRGRPRKVNTPGNETVGMTSSLIGNTEGEWEGDMDCVTVEIETASPDRRHRKRKPVKLFDPTPTAPRKRSGEFQGNTLVMQQDEEEYSSQLELSDEENGRISSKDPDYQIGERTMIMRRRGRRRIGGGGGEEEWINQMDEMDPLMMDGYREQRTIRGNTFLLNGIPFQMPILINVNGVIEEAEDTEEAVNGLIEEEWRMEEQREEEEGMEELMESREDHSYAMRYRGRVDADDDEIIDVVTVDEDEEGGMEGQGIESEVIEDDFEMDDDVEEIHEIVEEEEETSMKMLVGSVNRKNGRKTQMKIDEYLDQSGNPWSSIR